MAILLDQFKIPEQGTFALKIDRTITLTISAEQARRKVNIWLLTEVANMLAARTPTLVVDEQVVWRVPVVVTAPHLGTVGVVGEVNVDVQTGEMNITAEYLQEILQRSCEMGKSMPTYKPRTEISEKYLAKNYQPTLPQPTPDPAFVQKVMAGFAAEEQS